MQNNFSVSFPQLNRKRIRTPYEKRLRQRNNASGSTDALAVAATAAGIAALIPGGQVVAACIGLGAAAYKMFTTLMTSTLAMPAPQMWLCSYYQYYVLGQSAASTDHKANSAYYSAAVQWFTNFTGVPVMDNNQFLALKGFTSTGVNQNLALSTRVANYRAQIAAFGNMKSAGKTYAQASNQIGQAIQEVATIPDENIQLACILTESLTFATQGGIAGTWGEMYDQQGTLVTNAMSSGRMTLNPVAQQVTAQGPSTAGASTTVVNANPLQSILGTIQQAVQVQPSVPAEVTQMAQTAENVLNPTGAGTVITPAGTVSTTANPITLGIIAIAAIVIAFMLFD